MIRPHSQNIINIKLPWEKCCQGYIFKMMIKIVPQKEMQKLLDDDISKISLSLTIFDNSSKPFQRLFIVSFFLARQE